MDCEERCRIEVEQLHRFFQEWFRGELPKTEEAFNRFEGVMAQSFELVSPVGKILKRDPLLIALRSGHGGQPQSKLWIENFRHHHTSGDLSFVTYEEWHLIGEKRLGRLSTALLQSIEGTPNNLQWLHVHETWMSQD